MSERRVDIKVLDQMMRDGMDVKEIANILGVHWTTVYRAMKTKKKTIISTVALTRATEVVDSHLDMAKSMRRLNDVITKELERTKLLIEANPNTNDLIKHQEILLKTSKEIRGIYTTYLEMISAYRDFSEYEKFKNAVVELVKTLPKEQADGFIENLQRNRLLEGHQTIMSGSTEPDRESDV